MASRSDSSELGSTAYELFIAALSVLSLVNLVLVIVMTHSAARDVVLTMDLLLSVIFLVDFLVRLKRSPERAHYFLGGFGWADLLASLPLPEAKLLRIFRLVRVGRLIRRQGLGSLRRSLGQDLAGSALFTLLLVAILVLEFGSLLMVRLESDQPGANLTNAGDALWYVLVTMSTVGYGDHYPITKAGRILGAIIIVLGVGIFGTLTGYLANQFLSPRRRRAAEQPATTLSEARAQIGQLKELLVQQQRALNQLEAALALADGSTGRPGPNPPPA
ncbi:ion transporter [Monashia sp. NPDC004114]